MKILDRYISSAVAAAFFSGVMIFMVLLCAMTLFQGFIKLITVHGVAPAVAFSIFAYKIPGMLVYAFPMAMLLGILLVFSRMSAESEMVAIRAGGVSFVRIAIPAIVISLFVTGLTFVISNYYGPYASKRSAEIEAVALQQAKSDEVPPYTLKNKDGNTIYSLQAKRLETHGDDTAVMTDIIVLYYRDGSPFVLVNAKRAEWLYGEKDGYWKFSDYFINNLGRSAQEISIGSIDNGSFLLNSPAFRVTVSPFSLRNAKKDPADLTSDDIRRQVAEMRKEGKSAHDMGQWLTRLAQRYSTPFACLVFALIGAPLGLRHHRTSSAVGFGISMLVIFAFYFVNVYVTSFGDSGAFPPAVAAWSPNILGAILGVILLVKANR